MIAQVLTAAPTSITGTLVTVETDMKQGLPGITIVGMGNKAVTEARERVRSAITHSNLQVPARKFTVNLAPAELPKSGSHFDLALAVSLLVATGQLKHNEVAGALFLGELSLTGALRPMRGLLSALSAANRQSITHAYFPAGNRTQAQLSEGITAYPIENLRQLYRHLKGIELITPLAPLEWPNSLPDDTLTPLDNIIGQDTAKRALHIALAGGHNILLYGPPGTGKTLLAKAAASLQPPLSRTEAALVTSIHSLAGATIKDSVITPPFRSPHHTVPTGAFIGGGNPTRPGELSLAHHGILFLDELPEFRRENLEALRQPLEDKKVFSSRLGASTIFPADFLLIGTMNPCPCGYFGTEKCRCSQRDRQRYRGRISGPLLDRIDIVVHMSTQKWNEKAYAKSLQKKQHTKVFESIISAKHKQVVRYSSSVYRNGNCPISLIRDAPTTAPEATALLLQASQKLGLSVRQADKTLRVARTIADIENEPIVSPAHVAEALQLRVGEDW